MLTVGVVLLLLALIGFVNPDNAAATRSIAGVHFTQVMNIFDLITGALGVLCGSGRLSDRACRSAEPQRP